MKITDLTVSYSGKKIINGLNLEIGEGITCIMGESGCGKTTLLHTIAGLVKPETGVFTDYPKTISVMFQEDRLFPWLSALDNIKIVCEDENKARALLSAVELEKDADKMPSELSGGMKRRVALARTLSYDSELMILDEPFKGLDEALTERIAKLIIGVKVPVLLATHAESDIELLGAKKLVIRRTEPGTKTVIEEYPA